MGGCVSVSSQSTCSSRSNGERISPSCLWIDMFQRKRSRRTFSDHGSTLQHLSSVPNRIFANGRSSSSCIFTQQGRKGINQDAMIVWEVSPLLSLSKLCFFFWSIWKINVFNLVFVQDFMSEDVTFCGVFDGHGPHGHLVARKVRDTLPLKLSSFLNSMESKKNGSNVNCCNGNMKSDVVDPVKDTSVEEKVESLWREAFLKSYKAMDKELRSHPNLDCFCSGSTAVTVLKQVYIEALSTFTVFCHFLVYIC